MVGHYFLHGGHGHHGHGRRRTSRSQSSANTPTSSARMDTGSSQQQQNGTSNVDTMDSAATASATDTTSSTYYPPHHLTAEAVAALPPPGLSGPTGLVFSPSQKQQNTETNTPLYLAFVSALPGTSSTSNSVPSNNNRRGGSRRRSSSSSSMKSNPPSYGERQLCVVDCSDYLVKQQQNATTTSVPLIHPLLHALPARPSPMFPTSTTLSSSNHSHDQQQQQDSLEERLRRERQRLHTSGGSVTQFSWTRYYNTESSSSGKSKLRVLVPLKGNVYVQHDVGIMNGKDGTVQQQQQHDVDDDEQEASFLQCLHDKHAKSGQTTAATSTTNAGAIDPQLSPDGSMVAFVLAGDIYVVPIKEEIADVQDEHDVDETTDVLPTPIQITFGAQPQQHGSQQADAQGGDSSSSLHDQQSVCVTHGLADFIAQEEMDRYRGYWWSPDSNGILFTRVDESHVACFRIMHQGRDNNASSSSSSNVAGVTTSTSTNSSTSSSSEMSYEDHRYPFAGETNPHVQLGYVPIDRASLFSSACDEQSFGSAASSTRMQVDGEEAESDVDECTTTTLSAQQVAQDIWQSDGVVWMSPPREATEYLARASWLPDGSVWAQWQNRTQSTLVLCRMDVQNNTTRVLLTERSYSDAWINLHHMMHVLPRPIHPDECDGDGCDGVFPVRPGPLPEGSFSFLFASERSGYSHLYLYTYVPGLNGDQAMLLRTLSSGEWMVESIVGADLDKDVVYVTGTYDSPLERHLYALPLRNAATASGLTSGSSAADAQSVASTRGDVAMESSINGSNNRGMRRGFKSVMSALSGAAKPRLRNAGSSSNMSISETSDAVVVPLRLTTEPGMHQITMDDDCRLFVDSSSDLGRPMQVKVYRIPENGPFAQTGNSDSPAQLLFTLYDASGDDKQALIPSLDTPDRLRSLAPPEMLSYPTSDGTETLHAALYTPDPRAHGPGPYPLICAVYGGPHVQRVNRSWSQCADMRAQRLRSLGFSVVKCDNRGSSRRGMKFEGAIHRRLGRLEVLDQVTTVRQLTMRGIADPARVGIYGWSYGGYLSAMCLCRAPDVFHAAVAGAPVTSWDGYDTHYTERYMGLPADNPTGYRESAVLDHVPNMRGHLLLIHGLIDENVHFRHTARLINRLIAASKDYDLLIFPDERHSPRKLRDRIYMEQRISDYFLRHLGLPQTLQKAQPTTAMSSAVAGQPPSTGGGGDNPPLRTMAGHL